MTSLPLFPVTTVGSWPRPRALLHLQTRWRRGEASHAEFQRAADAAVLDVLRLQLDAGVDIVSDGEQRRDNFYSFVADKLEGVRLMTLADMLDVVEDKGGFEQLLQTLDVPAYAISNPTCIGPIARREPLAVDELRFLARHTDRPVKVALPGPYLLTRAMFVPEVSRAAYPTKEALAEDVVRILREEIAELEAAGAAFIQLDEPVLTELVFGQGRTRTFMCAALAVRRDPTEELDFAVSLVNRVVAAARRARVGLHVCRGNWSRNEATLLRGGYAPLAPYFARMQVRQLVLEYATERAGDLMGFDGKELGLGVVNPRTDMVESPDAIERLVGRALAFHPPERIFLNPDCGFGTFSRRPVNTPETAAAKLRAIVAAARRLRARFGAAAVPCPGT
ncbi:MAG TPA: cobalamin-independent methionine synthase II family protein [Vicinamibacterales bacterium]|nr:cobalamin-independent methionine synthase II family protein [Vicinamibacterales bacterium]